MGFSGGLAKNFTKHRAEFVRNLRCTDVLTHLISRVPGFDEEFVSKIQTKLKNDSEQEAVDLLLQRLESSSEDGKWLTFLGILEKNYYEMLVKLLVNEPLSQDREKFVERLVEMKPMLEHKIDPLELLSHLLAEKCINNIDEQNVKCAVTERGKIEGTRLLLGRITRLRDDWFQGFMVALKRAELLDVMKDVDPDYTEKILAEPESERKRAVSSLASELSALELLASNEDDDSEEISPCASPESPGLGRDMLSSESSAQETLTLRDYQMELHSAVPNDKNTLIVAPRGSGKTYVALKLIQDHLSGGAKPFGKVAYLVIKPGKPFKVMRLCQRFFGHIRSVEMPNAARGPPIETLSDTVQNNRILVGMAKVFLEALKEKSVNLTAFSMLILEMSSDFYDERSHVYKQMMLFYNELKKESSTQQSLPQIVVMSPSICGDSPLEDLFCTAMETCAQFHIEVTAMVQDNLPSLREHVSKLPVIEKLTIPPRHDNRFAALLLEQMSQVENVVKDTYISLVEPSNHPKVKERMSVLKQAPFDRLSPEYNTWLSTNKSRLGDAVKRDKCRPSEFFLTSLRLLTVFQNGLIINCECRSSDALRYMRAKVKQLSQNLPDNMYMKDSLIEMTRDFQEQAQSLEKLCSPVDYENPASDLLTKKVEELFRGNGNKKVVVLVKHRVSALSIMLTLMHAPSLEGIKVKHISLHDKDYTEVTGQLFQSGFNVLITTWPILCFHLGRELMTWDCVIRLDCPGNLQMSWQHQAEEVSQFSYERTPEQSSIDLLLESTLYKSVLDVIHLQEAFPSEYEEIVISTRVAGQEREKLTRRMPRLNESLEEGTAEIFCQGCGMFVCMASYIRKLDDLWIGLDPKLIYRVKTLTHPANIVFSNGYSKLGRMVCRICGKKWGIVVHVLQKPFLSFAKDGLDILKDGHFQKYTWKWKHTELPIKEFEYARDLLRCLPDSFCVAGRTITDLVESLPDGGRHPDISNG